MCEWHLFSLKLTERFQGKTVCLKMRLSIAKILNHTNVIIQVLFIISNNYDRGLLRMRNHA